MLPGFEPGKRETIQTVYSSGVQIFIAKPYKWLDRIGVNSNIILTQWLTRVCFFWNELTSSK